MIPQITEESLTDNKQSRKAFTRSEKQTALTMASEQFSAKEIATDLKRPIGSVCSMFKDMTGMKVKEFAKHVAVGTLPVSLQRLLKPKKLEVVGESVQVDIEEVAKIVEPESLDEHETQVEEKFQYTAEDLRRVREAGFKAGIKDGTGKGFREAMSQIISTASIKKAESYND